MVTYLTVQSGPEKGKHFPLDPERPMHIGRGSTCEIMLSDPISSRFHAVVYFEDGNWHLRDTSSSNGTFVNGQKAQHARMLDQAVLRIGSTELRLIEPEVDPDSDDESNRTVIQGVAADREPDQDLDPLGHLSDTGHLLDLYSLSLSLLRSDDANDVSESVLRLLLDRSGADAVGLSFDSGDGRYKPHQVVPADLVKAVKLSRSLIRRVVGKGEAIWTGDRTRQDDSDSDLANSEHWSDAIYVPLDSGENNLGVLHLYRREPSFNEADFELAVAAGRLLAVALSRALKSDSLKVESKRIAQRNADTDELIGSSATMAKLKEKIARVGQASGSVLVRGESGSGKELVARAVYRQSNRAMRPMLTVNCAAIPQSLIESQLFGHKKGSFTGADSDHIGWFQQAHTGTLFLDEIGELTLEGQAKLLRILEGHPFLPVGATEEVLVDVRVIAATNRDLAEFVREKKFREDLFYRLSVFELVVPPLRERGDDIELLVQHFLHHFRVQHGRGSLGLSDDTLQRLLDYAWPGNVRQLRNVIDSAVVMADDPEIMPEDLGLRDAGLSRLDTLRIDEWEKRLIDKALRRTSGSVHDAAKLLGISRATAYRKISEYDIQR
ncbi:sigma 54-interacting transcriptional regulator [Planctomycetes bacterium K23_9]|uniref:Nitrogen fixation protein VnfA n=1 Tax=Stieleria marina TaxID=1930275 RepID=A0A517NQ57_9BACT|nr:Nitrogen fixation protein VnfA [Planctomycetes bacterium K23_9]